jgi:hypothetical protein
MVAASETLTVPSGITSAIVPSVFAIDLSEKAPDPSRHLADDGVKHDHGIVLAFASHGRFEIVERDDDIAKIA